MALTLLRHAALAKEYENCYNGWKDLSIDPSRFDDRKVALLRKQKFDLIYSSDLLRCQQTLEMMDIDDYVTDERLREVRFKEEIEGLNFHQVEQLDSFRAAYLETREAWHAYICAESQEAFERRIRSFLSELPQNKEILICSHGGTLQKMMTILGYTKNKIDYLEHIRIDNVI